MKVILTRPVKISGEWKNAGEEVNITNKKEQSRLEKKSACIVPLSPSKSDDEVKEAKA